MEPRLQKFLATLDQMHRRQRLWRELTFAWLGVIALGVILFLLQCFTGSHWPLAWMIPLLAGLVAAAVGWIRYRSHAGDFRYLVSSLEREHPESAAPSPCCSGTTTRPGFRRSTVSPTARRRGRSRSPPSPSMARGSAKKIVRLRNSALCRVCDRFDGASVSRPQYRRFRVSCMARAGNFRYPRRYCGGAWIEPRRFRAIRRTAAGGIRARSCDRIR